MGSHLLREQGIRPHTLADHLISKANNHPPRHAIRSTPHLNYDTTVHTQQSQYVYRTSKAQVTPRVVDFFTTLHHSLPEHQREETRKNPNMIMNMNVKQPRPLVHENNGPLVLASSRK